MEEMNKHAGAKEGEGNMEEREQNQPFDEEREWRLQDIRNMAKILKTSLQNVAAIHDFEKWYEGESGKAEPVTSLFHAGVFCANERRYHIIKFQTGYRQKDFVAVVGGFRDEDDLEPPGGTSVICDFELFEPGEIEAQARRAIQFLL